MLSIARRRAPKAHATRSFGFYVAQDYNQEFKQRLEAQHLVKSDKEYRFAVVGCGPAGFYCAK